MSIPKHCMNLFSSTSSELPNIAKKYFQHRNGNYYYVLNTSIHTETQERLVNYMMLYDTHSYSFGSMWARPLKMWSEIVEGKPRFTEIVPPKEILDRTQQYLKMIQ